MDKPLLFSQLSVPRQRLIRAFQSINYGSLFNLLVESAEPLLGLESPLVQAEVRLDTEDPPRPEIAIKDFTLCVEVRRLLVFLDRIGNGTIAKIEVRAGIPRRLTFEHQLPRGKGIDD